MILDHDKKYVYVAIPKTASISVSISLGHGDNIPEPDFYHQGITSVLTTNPEAVTYFKFSFVRNPWARLLSLYNDFTLKRVFQYSEKVQHDKPLFSEFADFNDFCIRLHDSSWMDNIFLRSQAELLSLHGRTVMDYIGRFETLHDDFSVVCSKIGMVGTPLLKHNEGKYDNTSYRPYYTIEAKDAIARLYDLDIEVFGYDF
jgi:hypothetical protein